MEDVYMRGVQKVMNHMRFMRGNSLLVIMFLAFGLLSFAVLGLTQSVKADIRRDCDDNAIIRCGVASAAEFKQKYDANAPGDLHTIYSHYWIPRDIQVVQGYSYKDNTVRVNGRIVAKNAESIGRQKLTGERAISIGGKTYYQGPNSTSFASDAIPTLVALDAQGNFKYAILQPCGNPVYATPVPPTPTPTPKYTCDKLVMTDVSTTNKRFDATASASGGATIASYTYDFGDGSSQTSSAASISHTYAKAGTYTARVTANVNVSNATKQVTSNSCTAQVTIKAPSQYACTSLNAASQGGTSYTYTIQQTSQGVTYQGAKMDYGDGTTQDITGTTASHTYAKPGNYTVTATLSFSVDGAVKSVTCQTQIGTTVCPTNTNLPKDSPDCVPCPYDSSLPKDSDKCVAPVTELPQTGPSDMILGGVGIGSMVISASLYAGSRKDLLAALIGR